MSLSFGSILFNQGGASVAQTFTTTPALLTAFSTGGTVDSQDFGDLSVTPVSGSDHIKVKVGGTYLVLFDAAFETADTGKYTMQLYADDAIKSNLAGRFTGTGSAAAHHCGFHGIYKATDDDDTDDDGFVELSIYGSSGSVAGITAFPNTCQLSAIRVD